MHTAIAEPRRISGAWKRSPSSSRLPVLFLAAAITIGHAVEAQILPEPVRAKLECFVLQETVEFNFGVVGQHETVEHVFVFKNTCRTPVEIASVKPSCGCTAAVVSARTVPPGESSRISVKFTPPPGSASRTTKTVSVYLRDDIEPHVILRLTADVRPELETEPARIVVDSAEVGVPFTRTITVRNQSKDLLIVSGIPFSVTSYTGNDSTGVFAKGELLKSVSLSADTLVLQPGASQTVKLRIVPEHPGRIEGSLRFSTLHSEVFVSLSAAVVDRTEARKKRRP